MLEEGTLAVLPRGVRFFCMGSQVYLGREMRVAAWAYVFGWCSYTPEPGLLETRGRARGGGGGRGSQDIGQTVPQGALTLESHYLGSIPAPSLTGCATLTKSQTLSEPPFSQHQRAQLVLA